MSIRLSSESLTSAVAELLRNGFVEIEITPALLEKNVEPIIRGIQKMTMCKNGLEIFPGHTASIDEVGWKMEAGLYRRSGKDASNLSEEKYFFHYAPHAKWPDLIAIRPYTEFLHACDELNTAAKQIGVLFAREIDRLHAKRCPALPNLQHGIEHAHTITRVLRYLERAGSSADAYTHLDRGILTVHWYASHPGLVIFDKEGRPHRVDENSFVRIVVFLSKKFAGTFAGEGDVRERQGMYGFGVPHGVRDPRRDSGDRTEDRFSIVSFVHGTLSREAAEWIRCKTPEMDAFEREHPL